jgi:hypothetical protein
LPWLFSVLHEIIIVFFNFTYPVRYLREPSEVRLPQVENHWFGETITDCKNQTEHTNALWWEFKVIHREPLNFKRLKNITYEIVDSQTVAMLHHGWNRKCCCVSSKSIQILWAYLMSCHMERYRWDWSAPNIIQYKHTRSPTSNDQLNSIG